MKKLNKFYKEAVKNYHNGNIDTAIELCEKCTSEDFRNMAALNLKGLLYYIKGDLNECRKIWRLNYKANRDQISKKYLEDSYKDEQYMEIYIKSVKMIKELNIIEAIQQLEKCLSSHFNYINVNNSLSSCYIKRGEYNKAVICVNEVLKLDKKNEIAKKNKKILKEFDVIEKNINVNKIFIISAVLIFFIVSIFLIRFTVNNLNRSKDNNEISKKNRTLNNNENNGSNENKIIQNITDNVDLISGEEPPTSSEEKNESSVAPDETDKQNKLNLEFPEKEMENCIKSDNYPILFNHINNWKDKNLNEDQLKIIQNAENKIKDKGSQYFYNEGGNYFNKGIYNKAIEYYDITLYFGKNNYLYEHALYMAGRSANKIMDVSKVDKYYNKYIEIYPKGNYIEDVLLDMVMMYKDIDIDKAKKYAKKINDEYTNSPINNSYVRELISN